MAVDDAVALECLWQGQPMEAVGVRPDMQSSLSFSCRNVLETTFPGPQLGGSGTVTSLFYNAWGRTGQGT